MWAEAYDRELRDIFQISSEVTKSVVREIKATLTPREQARLTTTRTVNPEAHEAYLRGRYHWNKRTAQGLQKAITYFERAIEIDSDFALAYSGLADSYNILTNYALIPSRDAFTKAKEYALKALEIDEAIAEARVSLADIKYEFEWDWGGSEEEFRQAIAMNPSYATGHHWYAWFLFSQGRFAEAHGHIQKALKLDPLSVVINRDIGTVHLFARNYDQAIEPLKKAIEMDPSFPLVHYYLGTAYMYKAMFEEALREFQVEREKRQTYHPFVESQFGIAYVKMGKREQAERILTELIEQSEQKYIPPTQIARLCFNLGKTEQGFEWLQAAAKQRDEYLTLLKVDSAFDVVRADPRFISLLERIGLKE
ncbi:MAG: tetratricopeptide repeat protein [Phycisphaerae bacterium]|nr:tetratricopeptide repeat protein [Phycisphaerae bacterium]